MRHLLYAAIITGYALTAGAQPYLISDPPPPESTPPSHYLVSIDNSNPVRSAPTPTRALAYDLANIPPGTHTATVTACLDPDPLWGGETICSPPASLTFTRPAIATAPLTPKGLVIILYLP